MVLYSPLSTNSLYILLNITKQKIDLVLKDLYIILDILKASIYPLRLHHPLFRNFLLDNKGCKDPNL